MDMNVALKISAGVTGQQAVDQLKTSMDRMKDSVDGVANRFGVLKGAVAALAGTAVVTGFVGMMKSMIDTADHLNDLSQRTGIAVEDLDALGFAAEQNGSNLDQVSGALGKLAKNMAEAAGGSAEAIATFRQFGITQQELKSGSITTTEAMAKIADKLAEMPDGWQKTAAAQRVFGKSAADLIPLLNAGGDAIRNARAELEGYGALFDGGIASAADEFNDKMALFRRITGALALSLGRDLLPVMNGFVSGLVDAKSAQDGLSGDTSLVDWAKTAAMGVAALVDVVRVAGQGILALIGSFQAVWADLKLAGTFLAGGNGLNPFSAENKQILSDALAERNQTVERANQQYVTLWKMNGSQVFDAVKKQMDNLKSATSPSSKGPGGTGGFDFGSDNAAMKERASILEKLRDEVYSLERGEDALLLQKARAAGMSATELAQLQELLTQRAKLKAADRELEEATKEANKQRDEAIKKQKEMADAGKRVYDETRTPAEKLNIEITRLNELLNQGAIDWDTYSRAIFNAQDEFDGIKDKGKDAMDELKQAVEGWGRQATDAFVEFVFTGKSSFKDLVNSILQDIARMVIQKTIMAPLMASVGKTFGFADGGVMTGSGPLPLRKYASGGIATSPQLALYGEGKMPEAYVPLPDGRTIPVTMNGGAGAGSTNNVTVNVNVESGSEQVKSSQGAGELGRAISAAVKQELINQKRPGGLLAA